MKYLYPVLYLHEISVPSTVPTWNLCTHCTYVHGISVIAVPSTVPTWNVILSCIIDCTMYNTRVYIHCSYMVLLCKLCIPIICAQCGHYKFGKRFLWLWNIIKHLIQLLILSTNVGAWNKNTLLIITHPLGF